MSDSNFDWKWDALVASQGKETKRLVALHFDDIRRVPLSSEPIRIGDEIVGRVKSGGQGFTIGEAIGYAYLPVEHSRPATEIEVEFFGQWAGGVVTDGPIYDPTGSRIRN